MPSRNPSAPRVSVVLAVYNGEPYLAEAVESVLAQTLTDFERVAIDDGSTDGSGALLDRFAARDSRVRVFRQPNGGLSAALNRGLALARSPLVARMDADDVCRPVRLARQVEVFECEPATVLVSSDFLRIGPAGDVTGVVRPASEEVFIPWHLLFYNVLGGHAQVTFRRDAAWAAGGYDEAYLSAQDYDLWCRLLAHGRLRILPELLLSYRVHPGSLTTAGLDRQLGEAVEIAQRHIERALGLELELERVETLRRFWRGGRLRNAFPEGRSLGTVERDLRTLYGAFLRAPEGQALSRAARAGLRRRVAECYLRWAGAAELGQSTALRFALAGHALRWDPTSAPTAARMLAGRPAPGVPSV